MSLKLPDLDDRVFDEIINDARKRIPVYTEQWTDHNASDPGVTLLELLAWLAETYTYQLDRITDTHRRKYLALLGEQPRPAQPATVDLKMSLPDGARNGIVGPGTKFRATDGSGVTYGFETTRETRLTAANLVRVLTDGDRGQLEYSTANETPGMHFPAFDESAAVENMCYLGFDKNPFFGSNELSLTVRLYEADLPEPATHGENADSWPEPNEGEFEPSVRVEWQYCAEPENHDGDATNAASRDSDDRTAAPRKNDDSESDYDGASDDGDGGGENYRTDDGDGDDNGRTCLWKPFEPTEDETRQFYQSGRVTLEEPGDWAENGEKLFGSARPYWWIRCVVKEGGYEIAPRVDSITVNVVPVEHRWTVEHKNKTGEPLVNADGESTATALPNQRFRFVSPFESATVSDDDRSVSILVDNRRTDQQVDGDDGNAERPDDEDREVDVRVNGEPWNRVDDFDSSGPHSKHYVLDYARGEVRFGDGSRGKLPPMRAEITARKYAFGGGVAGNLPTSTTWAFDGSKLTLRNRVHNVSANDVGHPTITQLEAATGGTDAESIEDAFDRLLEDRQEPYRAVSLADYEYLATHTPELRFGRAAARLVPHDAVEKTPRRRVGLGCGAEMDAEREHPLVVESETEFGGDSELQSVDETDTSRYCEPHAEVRVVIVPYSRSSKPTPSNAFRDAVQDHLNRHRLLTDRVTVEPPRYVEVTVEVEIRLESDFGSSELEDAVETALDEFLDPLRGFDGEGWPFGRTLYRSELYEVVEGVSGVDCVTRLVIQAPSDKETDVYGNVLLDETELFAPGDHTVTAQIATGADQCGEGK